ncbi:phage tail protein [Pseudomonas sp. FYR_2]|uniref:phage tail-collar fiber domain-containing protein n=1 Tax=unclassified Pseudomonas TaxID=196821 RepID=UPI00370BEB99
MSTTLQPVITKVGLAAIWNKSKTGLSAEITHVVLGTSAYTPSADQTTLRTQVGKYPIAGGEQMSSTLLHLTALADGPAAFWVREVGFLLSDGTLLAVWSSSSEPLTYKASGEELLLAYDVSLSALPAGSVTINTTPAGLSLTMAAPFAQMAAAAIAEQLRSLQAQERAEAQGEVQRIAGEQIANLMQRMKAVEQRQESDHDGLLSVAIANAAAVISLQNQLVQHINGA